MPNLILSDKEYPNIQNIIFDLGGVIMNIDYQRVIIALKEIGINDFDKFYNQLGQIDLFDNYDKGLITPAEFRKGIHKVSRINVSDEAFDRAWNLMLVDIPEDRIRLLKSLKKHFKTFLLSNTNEIHLKHLFEYTQKTYNLINLDPLFNNTYYSCRVHMRKPNTEIYLKVLDDENLKAAETLFIDDFQPNIDAAVSLGIKGYCLTMENSITALFTEYI
jgi:HAD superfamily hydrolase (TIGR01509 family)